MKINPAIFIICSLFPLLLAGCSLPDHSAPPAKSTSACIKVSAEDIGVLSAEKQYDYMVDCVKSQQFNRAAVHYAIAGVLTWYDYLATPGDMSRQQHQTQLRKQLAELSDNEKRLLWEELNFALRDAKRLDGLCSIIVLPESNKRSKMLWQQAKTGYLHCINEHYF